MRVLITIVFTSLSLCVCSQVFERGEVQGIVKQASNHIYNAHADSAAYYIRKAEKLLPDHPVVPLMRGMSILWTNIPLISDVLFEKMEYHLHRATVLAEAKDPDLENPEMIFFSMAAYGLLAEYHADQGATMKAVGEANKAYGLMKKGFEIVDDNPEFLLTTGLYNYFREKYPEKHPIYKPLLWFFRSGDKELGLQQLNQACKASFLTTVEAHVYLSYIYLRYEYDPEKAQQYLAELCDLYPNNLYAQAKYLESLTNPQDFKNVPMGMIDALKNNASPYYKLAGNVFAGYFEEIITGNWKSATQAYELGLSYGETIPHHGEFFKSFGYLGLARTYQKLGRDEQVIKSLLHKALKYAETDQVTEEAKELLAAL